MYCNNCNLSYPEETTLCPSCGAALEAEEIPTAAESTDDSASNVPAELLSDAKEVETAPSAYPYAPELDPAYTASVPGWDQTPKKKSGKKIFWTVFLSVIGLALVAVIIAVLFFFRSPYYRLYKGGQNSLSQLQSLTNGSPFLNEMMHSVAGAKEESSVSMEGGISAELFGESISLGTVYTDFAYSRLQKLLHMNMGIRFDSSMPIADNIELALNADAKELRMRLNDSAVLTAPTVGFGQSFAGSKLEQEMESEEWKAFLRNTELNLFANASFTTFLKEGGAWKDLIRCAEIDDSEASLAFAPELDVYSIRIDCSEFDRIYGEYLLYQLESIFGTKAVKSLPQEFKEELEEGYLSNDGVEYYRVYVGMNRKDCIAALQVHPEGKEEDSFYIRLDGEENLWNKVLVHSDGTDKLYTLEAHADGLKLNADEGDTVLEWSELKKEFTLLHKGAEYTLHCFKDEETLCFELECSITTGKEEDALLSLNPTVHLDLEIIISPFRSPEPMTGETKPLFDCSLDDIDALVKNAVG